MTSRVDARQLSFGDGRWDAVLAMLRDQLITTAGIADLAQSLDARIDGNDAALNGFGMSAAALAQRLGVAEQTIAVDHPALIAAQQALIAQAQTIAAQATRIADLETAISTAARFVSKDIQTVAKVLTDFPAASARRGMYVRVSDLYGYTDGVMRCEDDGTGYYWRPTTPEYGRSMALVAGMSVKPLTFPTSIILTGSVLAGLTSQVTLDPTNAPPGQIKEIKSAIAMGLGSVLNIGVLGLGTVAGMLFGGYQKYVAERKTDGSMTYTRLV